MISKPHYRNFTTHSSETEQQPPQQQTVPEPILSTTPEPVTPPSLKLPFKRKFSRIITIINVLALVIAPCSCYRARLHLALTRVNNLSSSNHPAEF